MAKNGHPNDPTLTRLTEEIAASGVAESIVLYGPAAHGDDYDDASFNVLIVLETVDLASLRAVAAPIARWLKKGRPMPRLFSPKLLQGASDVFPIELLDIADHHVVLHGEDPLTRLQVSTDHLRLQCERELREKLLRLEEGFLEAEGRDKRLRELIGASYLSFALVFRGCLRLLGAPPPKKSADVHRELCRRAGLDAEPFDAAERLERGERPSDVAALFARYYAELQKLVEHVDSITVTRETPHG